MPYIASNKRESLDNAIANLQDNISQASDNDVCGILNYTITSLLIGTFQQKYGACRYIHINTIMGIISCVAHEFYRRIASGYEDKAIVKNGDVSEIEAWSRNT